MPRPHQIEAIANLLCRFIAHGNSEIDTPELMGLAIDEHHVLGRSARIAETIPEVEPEAAPLLQPGSKATEAVQALQVLGYDQSSITAAMKGIDVENLETQDIIKQALRAMTVK